jgi:hypothetical protein
MSSTPPLFPRARFIGGAVRISQEKPELKKRQLPKVKIQPFSILNRNHDEKWRHCSLRYSWLDTFGGELLISEELAASLCFWLQWSNDYEEPVARCINIDINQITLRLHQGA